MKIPWLLAFSACLHLAAAQEAVRPAPSLKTHTSQESRLIFPLTCSSRTNSACDALLASDVRVTVDGATLPPDEVSLRHDPGTFLIVLDGLNTPLQDLVRSRDAVEAYLSSGDAPPSTGILLITDTKPRFRGAQPQSVTGWELKANELYIARFAPSKSGADLAAALSAWEPSLPRNSETQAETVAATRVRDSLQSLSFLAAALRTNAGPTTLAWISPGWPNVHLNQNGLKGQVFDTVIYFDDAVRSARIVLHAIDPTGAATDRMSKGDAVALPSRNSLQHGPTLGGLEGYFGANSFRDYLKAPRSARDADPNDMLLPVLALHSGGSVQVDNNNVEQGLAAAAKAASSVLQMSIPSSAIRKAGPYHSLSLRSQRSDADVRSVEGFYVR